MSRGLCLLALLLAAAGPARAADSPSPTLEARVHQLMSDHSLRPLASGDSLRSGEWVGFTVRVDQPAYVYVVQKFADGSATIHYPKNDEDVLLQPGLELPIPGNGNFFELDDDTGEERIFFIATVRPLGDTDSRLKSTLELIRHQGKSARGEGSPRPWEDFGMPDRRGMVEKKPSFVKVTVDNQGVAVFAFLIRHLPRR
jgi:hypothetical protein